ncbi:MAG: ABC transporter permease subunit [Streptosporangiales bacterium]|nr:ABC transporter permease subunit [Streptosporangiales bacterium]
MSATTGPRPDEESAARATTATASVREAARPSGARPPGAPRRIGYLYVLPALLVYAAFLLWPLLHGAWISLYAWDGLSVGTFVGLANYVEVFTDEELRASLGHALFLVLFYAVLPCLIGFVLVAAMSRARVRGLTFFRTVLFLPQVVAMVAVAVIWKWIYAADGPLNAVLGLVGLDRAWLGDFTFALPAIGLIGTWVEIGLVMVLFMAGVQKIPMELYDAARVDGAGPVREFLTVTLPGLRRELSVALTLTTVAALRNFDLVWNTTGGGPGTNTRVPAYQVYNQAFSEGEVGLACAIGLVIAAGVFAFNVGLTRLVEGRR